ncbi:MAG: RNA polymerase sigma factor [Gammaproteobacteria bacterium]|nr:RNA polymerase sigma factor [Gammaproteobacteria bacterium]
MSLLLVDKTINNKTRESISLTNNDQIDEVMLITRVKQNDLQAFEQLYRIHSGRVFALCLRLSANRALAEELSQEAFVRAWQKIRMFRGESSFSSWLYRLTTNVVLSSLRKKQIVQVNIDDVPEQSSLTEKQLDTGEILDMEQAIMKLPDGARKMFVLHDIEGYQHNEIAEMTGLAIGTSKTQLHRARKLLQGWLL